MRLAPRLGLGRISETVRQRVIARTFIAPSHALWEAGHFERGKALLEKGRALFPRDPDLLYESMDVARREQRLSDAIDLAEQAALAAPDRFGLQVALAAILRAADQLQRAHVVIKGARQRFPAEVPVLAEAGRIAEARSNFKEALDCWETLCATAEPRLEWRQRQAVALIRLARFDEAERVLETALAPCRPDEDLRPVSGLLAARGFLAEARGDWSMAVELWTDFRTRFPDKPTGWQHLGKAQFNQALTRSEKGERDDPDESVDELPGPVEVGLEADAAKKKLLLGFESIGASCEFGLVQRRYGAEPLGLFRWNAVRLNLLIAALRQKLSGMGDPVNTALSFQGNGELIVLDRRWGFAMHTWMFEGQVERDALFNQMCRRVAFLRDKFLEDLAEPRKIYVFVSPRFDAHELTALHNALKAYGPAKLLAVLPQANAIVPDGAAGAILPLAPDLCIGFLSRLGRDASGSWNIVFPDWISVCERADAFFRSESSQRQASAETALFNSL